MEGLSARIPHVWRIRLDGPAEAAAALEEMLSPDERDRAKGMATGRLRRRFVAAHGETRRILGAYLQEDPRALRFTAGPHGKPGLDEPRPRARFNLSHSGELALLAVSADREVGVDVEWVDPRRDLAALSLALSPEERAEVERLPLGARRAALFGTWTRKEACLKAAGRGFTAGFDAARVSADPAAPPRLLSLFGDAEAAAGWSLVDLDCGPDYRGALAAEGSDWTARLFDPPDGEERG